MQFEFSVEESSHESSRISVFVWCCICRKALASKKTSIKWCNGIVNKLIILLFVLLFFHLIEKTEAKIHSDGFTQDAQVSANQVSSDDYTSVFDNLILFYQKILSPIKQQNCPMYPSCSNYALQCIRKYGMKGIFYTIDRLNRCGHDLWLYETVIVDAEIYYLDLP